MLPLINVVFLLLVFFMLAGTINQQQHADFLSVGSTTATDTEISDVLIVIDRHGNLHPQGLVRRQSGKFELPNLATTSSDPVEVHIKVDQRAAASVLLNTLDSLRASGFTNVKLLTLPTENAL